MSGKWLADWRKLSPKLGPPRSNFIYIIKPPKVEGLDSTRFLWTWGSMWVGELAERLFN